jgi:hypothetical protein
MPLRVITRAHDYNQDFAQQCVCVCVRMCVCVFYVGIFYNINGVPEKPAVVTAVHVAGRTVLARKQDPSVIFGLVMLIIRRMVALFKTLVYRLLETVLCCQLQSIEGKQV